MSLLPLSSKTLADQMKRLAEFLSDLSGRSEDSSRTRNMSLPRALASDSSMANRSFDMGSMGFDTLFQEFCTGRIEAACVIERLRITVFNDTFLALFELSAEEAQSVTPGQLVSDASSAALFGALTSATPVPGLELTGRRKKGTFAVEISVRPLPQRTLVFFRDLSTDRQMDALKDLRAAATCVPEQMLSSLRTIEELVDILLRDEALGRTRPDDHAGAVVPKDCAQMIKVPTAFLTTLSHDFANFNKLLSGLVILEEAEFDLYRMVEELSVRIGNTVTPYIGVDVPRQVFGDPTCLKQVVLSVVKHCISTEVAERHTEIQMLVDLDPVLHPDAQAVSVRFSFSGSGRDDWLYSRATTFDMGFQLPIARKLVELMRGKMGVTHADEATQVHSAFWFSVTFTRAQDLALPRDDAFKDVAMHVLVLERNPAVGKLVQSHLTSLHCTSTQVTSFTEAWNLLRSPFARACDVVLVSEELAVEPGASNFVLSLRGSTQWHLPLVLLTRTGQVDSKFMRSNGMTESVPRPISLVTLRSTFERLLGLQAEKAEPTGGPRQQSNEVSRFSSGENVQHTDILLVDDNVVNQKILANILKQMGLDYDIASDGKQAVEAYVAHPRKYGVILMDTMMPVMDGFEAAREIRRREHGTSRHVPIIAVTGIAAVDQRFVGKSENAEAECIRSGMDEYIPKPVIMKNLKATILKWLNKSSKKRSIQALRTLKDLCIAVVSGNLHKVATFDGMADELIQRIHDVNKDRRMTLQTVQLFCTAQLTRISIHAPFPAFKIDPFLQVLLANQRLLEDLDLHGCRYLTDRGLSFIAPCTSLTTLNLAKCEHISDWGLSELRGLVKLKYLNLDGCPLVSDSSVRLLQELPDLKEIVWFELS